VVAASVAGIVLILAGGSVLPGRLQTMPIDNPFGLRGLAGTVAWAVTYTGVALHWASLMAALICVVLRYRASRGTERQQLRWVGAGAAAAVIGLLLAVPGLLRLLPSRTTDVVPVGLLCPPVGVAVAVLRYRLWDLDRLVSRTVTYALVTALLVIPYVLIVPGTWPWPPLPWPRRRCSSRCAAASSGRSTGALTAAATTPPRPWSGSRPGSGIRSTWTPCRASC
jgi:hypothetical protein